MHQGNSSVDNSSDDVFKDADVVMVSHFFIIFNLLYAPLIIVFNLFVQCGLVLYPGFHEAFDYFLLSLGVSNVLVAVIYIPMCALSHLDYTRPALLGNKYACLLSLSSVTLARVSSPHWLTLIAADRYTAIAFPEAYRTYVTRKTAAWTILIVWCYVLFLAFSPMLGCNRYRHDIASLTRRCSPGAALPRGYFVLVWLVYNGAILLASCVICLCTTCITIRQKRKSKKEKQELSKIEILEKQNLRDSIKITYLLVIFFLLLWLPSLILESFIYYDIFTPKTDEIVRLVSQGLRFSSSLFNASVYPIFKTRYSEVLGLMLNTLPWKWRADLESLYYQHADVSPVAITMSFSTTSTPVGSLSSTNSDASDTTEYIFNKFEDSVALRRMSLYSAMNRVKSALVTGKYHKHDREMFLAMLMMDNQRDMLENTESDTYLSIRQLLAKHGTDVDPISMHSFIAAPQKTLSLPELHTRTNEELHTKKRVELLDIGEVSTLTGVAREKSHAHLPLRNTPSSAVDQRFSFVMPRRRSIAATVIYSQSDFNEKQAEVESTVDPLNFDEDVNDTWFWNENETVARSQSSYELQESSARFPEDKDTSPFS